ncbi:MAG: TM1802 family CRISPR-associated protein, partial [Candidatus Micrarchaeaceae archaeon]
NIIADLKQIYQETVERRKTDNKQEALILLSLCIQKNGKTLCPGNLEEFQKQEWKNRIESFEPKGFGTCSICGNTGDVYGNVLSAIGLKFATTDQAGFTYGLSKKEAWKNYPLCLTCADNVSAGYRYIKNYLTFNKGGKSGIPYSMMVIPNAISADQLSRFCNLVKRINSKKPSEIVYAEDLLGSIADENHDFLSSSISINLLFYVANKNEIKIISYVKDVTPSRLKFIYDTAKGIYNDQGTKIKFLGQESMERIFGYGSKEAEGPFIKEDINVRWVTFFLLTFFREGENGPSPKFLDIMGKIYTNIEYPPDLFSDYLKVIKSNFYITYKLKKVILKALTINLFMSRITYKGECVMNEDLEKNENLSGMERFFEETGLTDNGEKAALAGGVLAGRVLRAQRINRDLKPGQEPFWQEFGDISTMDIWKLRDIIVKSINKLQEYDYSRYEDIRFIQEKAASLALNNSLDNTPRNRIGFYFIAGVVLGESIVPIKYNKMNYEDGVKNE